MTRRTRRAFFYALVLLFLIGGSAIVLYAQGWRIDFAHWRPEKVGEIYVRSFPEDAAIMLDGKPFASNGNFLSPGTLIPDLLPKSYVVSLSSPGYAPWQENANVSPSLVVQFKYAVLVPEKAATTTIGPFVAAGLTSAGIVTQSPDGTVSLNGEAATAGVIAEADSRMNSIIVENPGAKAYFAYDLANDSSAELSGFFAKDGDGQTGTPDAFTGYAGGILWARFDAGKSISALYRFDGATQAVIAESSTIPGKTVSMGWITDSSFSILQSDGSLYRYDAGNDTITKIADDVVGFATSPDGAMTAAVERNGIEIFDGATGDYYRFNIPGASGAIWYHDDAHLFVVYPAAPAGDFAKEGHVSFLDLADANLANFATIAAGTSPTYDPNANSFYIIDASKNLERFDFPK